MIDGPEPTRRATDVGLAEATQTLRVLTSKIDLLARAVESREAQIEMAREENRRRIFWGLGLAAAIVVLTVLSNGLWTRIDSGRKIDRLESENHQHRRRNEAESKCSAGVAGDAILRAFLTPSEKPLSVEDRVLLFHQYFDRAYDDCTLRLSGEHSPLTGGASPPTNAKEKGNL